MDAGLYYSILLRPRLKTQEWPLLTLASALAVTDALKEIFRLDADIKWPNDVLLEGRKACGILAETFETKAGRACVIGIGVNLTREAYPQELSETASSVEELTGERPRAEELVEALTRAMRKRYELLQSPDGAREILREWGARSSYADGKRVRVSMDGESFEGVTRGLESDGALRVETSSGETKIVRAGDVLAVREKR